MAKMQLRAATQPSPKVEAKEQPKRNGNGNAIVSRVASLIDADKELQSVFEETQTAKTIGKRGPFLVANRLAKAVPWEVMKDMPVPKSEGGNNPARYPIQGKKTLGNRWHDMFDMTNEGVALSNEIEEIANVLAVKPKTKINQTIMDRGEHFNSQELNRLRARRNQRRQGYETAAAIIFQIHRFDELDEDEIILVYERDVDMAEERKGHKPLKPFIIRHGNVKERMNDYKSLTVEQFIGLDIDKAKLAMEADDKLSLYEAIKRSGGKGADDTEPEMFPTLKNADKALEVTAELAAYLEDDDKLTSFKSRLNGEGSDDAIKSLFAIRDEVTDLCKMYAKRFKEITEREAQAA